MKCDTCIHALDCMNFCCDETTHYKDYEEQPAQPWQIEDISVPFNVIVSA